jgi:flagellar hook-basal body complex protein FliE
MTPLLPTQVVPDLAPAGASAPGAPAQGGFERVLEKVDATLRQADEMAAGYAEGKVGLTQAVLASEQADTTFQFVIALRDRALSAYQQIMNLQV